jgi:hypothetical protein
VIGARRASWRIISSIEQKEESKGNEEHVARIRKYRQVVSVHELLLLRESWRAERGGARGRLLTAGCGGGAGEACVRVRACVCVANGERAASSRSCPSLSRARDPTALPDRHQLNGNTTRWRRSSATSAPASSACSTSTSSRRRRRASPRSSTSR